MRPSIPSRKRISLLGVGLTIATYAVPSRADDSAAAQALFDQGKALLRAHKYGDACPKLEESQRLDPALGTLLNLADCYENEGKLATAWSKFLELAAKARAAGQTERAQIGRERAAALAPKLSHLVIAVASPDKTPNLEIKRDGTVVGRAEWDTPIPADGGPHEVVASAPGKLPWSTSVNVREHATTSTVTIPELAPAPVAEVAPIATPASTTALPSTPSSSDSAPFGGGLGTQRVLALVTGGAGLVGLGVGTYFGIASMSDHNSAHSLCPNATCTSKAGVNEWNDALSAGDISTWAFVAGGAVVAGAAVLWFTGKPTESGAPSAQVGLGIGSVRLTGTW